MTQVSSDQRTISSDDLRSAIAGDPAALRIVTRLVPAGGSQDKVFPPTYQGGRYAIERRRVGEDEVQTVLLDSVQSQANRMEFALRAAYERRELQFPLLVADFGKTFADIGQITALDAPHRIADAIFRESLLDGTPFRETYEGKAFAGASPLNATPLFELCPTALVFGVWDSTGPRGGMGAKFARALVSEIVGFRAVTGVRTASRIDPLQIAAQSGPIYEAAKGGWTLREEEARKDENGKPVLMGGPKGGRPAAVNLGNVTPDLVRVSERSRPLDEDGRQLSLGSSLPGGVTIDHAVQTTVLSLPALRRLRFPLTNGTVTTKADEAARTVLAALALAAIAYQRREGYDLRSRCLLVPTHAPALELVPTDGGAPTFFNLSVEQARNLLENAVDAAREVGLPWREKIVLTPSERLVELVRRSREVAPKLPPEGV